MVGPDYGALGITFKLVRIVQFLCMLAVIGLAANFVSEIISSGSSPPAVLIGTLSIACIAVISCSLTFIFYLDNILHFLINTVVDCMLLISVVVVAVTVGEPLAYLNCQAIGNPSSSSSAYDFAAELGSSQAQNGGTVNFGSLAAATQTSCLEAKSLWGLSISLCILYAFSATCSVCLWKRKPLTTKDIEG